MFCRGRYDACRFPEALKAVQTGSLYVNEFYHHTTFKWIGRNPLKRRRHSSITKRCNFQMVKSPKSERTGECLEENYCLKINHENIISMDNTVC